MKPDFRRAGPADLPAVLAIERASFGVPWSEAAVRPELVDDGRHLPVLAVVGDHVAGFALIWVIVDELHLVNFAIDPAFRRRGVGRALLEEIFRLARERGLLRVTLEVRESNEAARALYRGFGFVEVALRPDYYPDTRENALIMLCELSGPPEP
jgi:ribosomal-protein-alanine N-acetyltransferase